MALFEDTALDTILIPFIKDDFEQLIFTFVLLSKYPRG